MKNPYDVLGVSPSATDEEVKSAYRTLAKKYHPDNYADSPLAEFASEKMSEINAAFDQIMDERRAGGARSQNPYANRQYGASSAFADVRTLIQGRRLVEAEELLDGVPSSQRDAEWYFLKGSIFYTKGWLDQALSHINTAVSMNPSNPEYRAALNQMMWQRNTGTSQYGGYRTGGQPVGGCDLCDCCTAWLCCSCMGDMCF